ncbi:MAG TPA: trigger factor [Jiangellaceae bacterium]|nr:trigger factor [Jiangellaceae bacterium]
MKSVVETLNPTRVRLAVEVPFAELEPSITSAYKRIAAQVTVPGFRKGKVPPLVIDQRVGRPVVLDEAVNEALPRLYGRAVEENELRPLGQPEVDVTDFADGHDLKFTVEVDVRPTVTLPQWEGLRVEVDGVEVSDDDVDTEMAALRSRFGTLVGVDRAAADGDFVMVDLEATKDGEPVDGGQATGVSYQIGSGQLVDGIDDAVTGLSAGESATFRTTLLGTNVGDEVDCTVTVTAVKEQELPDLDDDFAQMASEFDTLDELRADLRERAERRKRLSQAITARDRALDKLLEEAGHIPLPEGVIAAQVQEHFTDGHGDDDHRTEFEGDLRRTLTSQFVLDELVKAEELQVSQEELTAYILERAAQSGIDPNQLAQQYVQSGNLPALMAEVARGKALALVVQKAEVVDTSGRPVDLDRLSEDGLAAPGANDVLPSGIEFAELDETAENDEDDESADDEGDEARS